MITGLPGGPGGPGGPRDPGGPAGPGGPYQRMQEWSEFLWHQSELCSITIFEFRIETFVFRALNRLSKMLLKH